MKTNDNQSTISTPSDLQPIDHVFAELGQTKQSVLPAPVEPTRPRVGIDPRVALANRPVERSASLRPISSPRRDAESSDWFLRSLMVGLLLLAGFCLLKAAPGSPLRSRPVDASVTQHTVHKPIIERKVLTRDIGDFDVGMRASGKNPLREQVDPNLPEPNPVNCRKLVLRMTKESGRLLLVKLLRELGWIEANEVVEGGTFFLDLPEMGAVGDAYVEAILPSPTFEKEPGNLVTGTFAHEADPDTKILRVEFANGAVIKGVTDNHPFYSVEHHDYLPVGEMHEGDFVKVNDGVTKITRIESRFARPGEMLYNLETFNEHVYQVTSSAILVHNSCVTGPLSTAQKDLFRGQARSLWERVTGATAGSKGLAIHHRIPVEWSHVFPKANPNRVANLIGVDTAAHKQINNAWTAFRNSLGGRTPRQAEVMRQALDIDKQFGHLFEFLP